MPIQFAIPTHGRPFGMTTHLSLMLNGVRPEDIHIFYHTEDERERYESIQIFHPDINVHVTDSEPSMTMARNTICERMGYPFVMIDDDIQGVYCVTPNRVCYEYRWKDYLPLIEHAMYTSLRRGASLFGCSPRMWEGVPPQKSIIVNGKFYGGLLGFIEKPPEPIPLYITHSEDFYLQLMYLSRGKRTLRFNDWFMPLLSPGLGGCDAPFINRITSDFRAKLSMIQRWGTPAKQFIARDWMGIQFIRQCITSGKLDFELKLAGVTRAELSRLLQEAGFNELSEMVLHSERYVKTANKRHRRTKAKTATD